MKPLLLLIPVGLAAGISLWQGPEAPAPRPLGRPDAKLSRTGTWTVDPMHSWIGFDIEHLGISKVRGRFDKFSGTIVDDEQALSRAKVTFTADISSIDTQIAPRDNHLKSKDFFDAERYPELKFESTSVEKRAKGFVANGNLTLHGVTRPVSIPFRMSGPMRDPMGTVRRGIVSLPFSIDRRDFGVSWQQILPGGAKALADTVDIEFALEAMPQAPTAAAAPPSTGTTATGTTGGSR